MAMKSKLVVRWVIIAGLFAGCGFVQKPDMVTLSMAAGDTALFGCDAQQTYAASNGGTWDKGTAEADPVQGSHPSGTRIYGLMVVNVMVASAVAVSPLPKWIKVATLGIIGLHVANTVHNNLQFVKGCGL